MLGVARLPAALLGTSLTGNLAEEQLMGDCVLEAERNTRVWTNSCSWTVIMLNRLLQSKEKIYFYRLAALSVEC